MNSEDKSITIRPNEYPIFSGQWTVAEMLEISEYFKNLALSQTIVIKKD